MHTPQFFGEQTWMWLMSVIFFFFGLSHDNQHFIFPKNRLLMAWPGRGFENPYSDNLLRSTLSIIAVQMCTSKPLLTRPSGWWFDYQRFIAAPSETLSFLLSTQIQHRRNSKPGKWWAAPIDIGKIAAIKLWMLMLLPFYPSAQPGYRCNVSSAPCLSRRN